MLRRFARSVSVLQHRAGSMERSGIRFFGKQRVIVDPSFQELPSRAPNSVELNPYNKIREMSKRSHLPVSHIAKALCTRDESDFLLRDAEGQIHRFSDERDIIIPYSIAEPYLIRCKKQCRCVEIDPELIPNSSTEQGPKCKRRSVFGVVGEMDHGKTTLLDTFLHTSYQKQEFGGTTQVIRASDMHIPYKTLSGETIYHPCTFLDTPGQSCFSFIRENGSILSDLSLYVVSLYEGPSDEARIIFQQMKENSVPILVVFTKSDLVSEQRKESVKQTILELASTYKVPILDMVTVSCVTGEGIFQLQQRLVELGQAQQPEVPIDCPAEATVLDSMVIPSQGIVFRALIQQGCLSVRNDFICGMYTGRIRNMIDLHSKSVSKATPGMVVNVLGARRLPAFLRKRPQLLPAGDTLFVRKPEEIKRIWEQRLMEFNFRASVVEDGEAVVPTQGKIEVIDGEEYMEIKTWSVIAVADNANSMAILLEQLKAKPNVSIIGTRVGQITDKDIRLCKESDVRIVSFNVNLPSKVVLSQKKFVYSRLMNELIDKLNEVFCDIC